MKDNKKSVELREIRRVVARINEISAELSKLPHEILPKKIFVGHWRFFVVREDVLRSSVGSQVSQVVARCNHWVLGKKKDPESYRSSTEVRYSPETSGWERGQGLHPLSEKAFEESGFPEHFKRKWFEKVTTYIRAGTKNIPRVRYFPKVPRHMLEYGYKPAYITEVTKVNGALESELARLNQFMEMHNGWTRLIGRHRDEWDLSLTKKKKLSKLMETEMVREGLEDF